MKYLPIIVGGLIPMIVGMVWYHKALFGQAWMDSIGLTEEKIKNGSRSMGVTMGISLVLSIILSFALKALLFSTHGGAEAMTEGGFMTFKHGAFHGAMIGAVVAIPVLVTNGLFEQKSTKNLLINSGYWIIAMSLMTGLLNAWQM